MVSTPVAILSQRAITPNVEAFLDKIKKMTRSNARGNAVRDSDFPVFKPANAEYFRYKRYENKLEWYIRDYLVSDIIYDLFEETYSELGIKCLIPHADEDDDRIIVRSKYSNEMYGEDYPFAFILSSKQGRVGYRYSGLCLSDDDFESWLKDYDVTHIEVIDWEENQSMDTKRIEWGVSRGKRDRVFYVTLHKFFRDHFSEELYNEYIQAVTKAVELANQEIGFHTIPQLSLKHLSEFRFEVASDIATTALGKMGFQKFDETNGEVSEDFFPLLSNEDRRLLDRRFYTEGLSKALIGREKFAQCFITSEFLYSVFRHGNERYFDYSAIATGYFKAVELLLEKMMDLSLEMGGRSHLWIKCGDPKMKPDDSTIPENKKTCRKNKHNVKEVRFRKEFRDSFSTEMGALIYFLCDNLNYKMGWLVTWGGMKAIRNCLLNYNKGCRNEHLHKDIINDIDTITIIRNNTLLCLYYLLGGYRYNGNSNGHDFQLLGIKEDSFDRLYRALERHKSKSAFYLQFRGEDVFKAIMLDEQEFPTYDIEGGMTSTVKFLRVNDFSIDSYNASKEDPNNLVVISCENIPEHIWWDNWDKGKIEIRW